MKQFIIILLIALLFTACDSSKASTEPDIPDFEPEPIDIPVQYIKITPQVAIEMMSGDVIILDVRTQEEFDEGYIKNAVLLPDYEIRERAAELVPDKNQVILIYCRRGRRSENAAKELLEMGYTNVYDFGGLETDWTGEVIISIDYSVIMRINENMPELIFRIEGVHTLNPDRADETNITKLTIYNENGSIKQEFHDLDTATWTGNEPYGLVFDDFNFDGYLDISLWRFQGGTIMNFPSYYWLWNDETGEFIRNDELEAISAEAMIGTDSDDELLTAFTRHGAWGHTIVYYRFIENSFVKVKEEDVRIADFSDEEAGILVTITELTDGEWVITDEYYM